MWPAFTTRAQKSVRMIPGKQGGLIPVACPKSWFAEILHYGRADCPGGRNRPGEQKCPEEQKEPGERKGSGEQKCPEERKGSGESGRNQESGRDRGERKCPEVPAHLKSAMHFKGDWNYALEKSGFERPGFPGPAER